MSLSPQNTTVPNDNDSALPRRNRSATAGVLTTIRSPGRKVVPLEPITQVTKDPAALLSPRKAAIRERGKSLIALPSQNVLDLNGHKHEQEDTTLGTEAKLNKKYIKELFDLVRHTGIVVIATYMACSTTLPSPANSIRWS